MNPRPHGCEPCSGVGLREGAGVGLGGEPCGLDGGEPCGRALREAAKAALDNLRRGSVSGSTGVRLALAGALSSGNKCCYHRESIFWSGAGGVDKPRAALFYGLCSTMAMMLPSKLTWAVTLFLTMAPKAFVPR